MGAACAARWRAATWCCGRAALELDLSRHAKRGEREIGSCRASFHWLGYMMRPQGADRSPTQLLRKVGTPILSPDHLVPTFIVGRCGASGGVGNAPDEPPNSQRPRRGVHLPCACLISPHQPFRWTLAVAAPFVLGASGIVSVRSIGRQPPTYVFVRPPSLSEVSRHRARRSDAQVERVVTACVDDPRRIRFAACFPGPMSSHRRNLEACRPASPGRFRAIHARSAGRSRQRDPKGTSGRSSLPAARCW